MNFKIFFNRQLVKTENNFKFQWQKKREYKTCHRDGSETYFDENVHGKRIEICISKKKIFKQWSLNLKSRNDIKNLWK